MYIDVRLYDNITNHKITASDFEVSCAGHAVVEENSPDNNRTNGLPDYQLLYIENGCGFFKFGEDYEKLPGKTVVLYHPHEPQIYKYRQKDKTQTYWLHFGGTAVEKLLCELELNDKKIITINNDINFKEYFKKVIDELQNKPIGYLQAANDYARLALISLSREIKTSLKQPSDLVIDNLCKKMNMDFYKDFSNTEYAEECNMSVSHFLSKFRKATGTSPQNYILNLRITNAQNLLSTTDYKIIEISKLVGFADSMYFCKRFKKKTGLSPSEYRQKFKF